MSYNNFIRRDTGKVGPRPWSGTRTQDPGVGSWGRTMWWNPRVGPWVGNLGWDPGVKHIIYPRVIGY